MQAAEDKAKKKIAALEKELATLKAAAAKRDLELKNKLKDFSTKETEDSELKGMGGLNLLILDRYPYTSATKM